MHRAGKAGRGFHGFPSLEAVRTPYLRDFVCGGISKGARSIINSISSLSPEEVGGVTELAKFLIIMVFLVTRPHPEAIQEPTSLNHNTRLPRKFQRI